MFCPSCGTEERQPSQFCRACGTDLRTVRTTMQQPDSITASAVTAREEIGRAVALKIQEARGAKDLKTIAEDVLPEIEKFLEAPEERRLRQIRGGVITASVGLGVTLFLLLFSVIKGDHDLPWPAGLIPFFIGLGIILNGVFFTVPKRRLTDHAREGRQQELLDRLPVASLPSGDTARNLAIPPSVTENTTDILEREPVPRRRNTQ